MKLVESPVDSQQLLGVSLVLALVVLLLAFPVAFLAIGAVRRIVKRMSLQRKPPDRRARHEAWTQAGERAPTPTAAELESQHGDGRDDSGAKDAQ
ncbi:MAG: hypothetical protein EXS17_07840 [Phycisphaerales bacterium]|nr:hypothetical protein [Phycisphaerales bacterium]